MQPAPCTLHPEPWHHERVPRLLWPLLNAFQSVLVVLWTAFWITVALAVSVVTRGTGTSLAMARRVWAPGILALGGARLVTRGLENLPSEGPVYIVSNHQSNFDIPALFAALPRPLRFVAKQELAAIPFLGWYIRAMGMITVDRARRQSGRSGALLIAEKLREGATILSFPAGTRSADGSIGRFKPGGFRAPIEAGAPILPVAIWGAHRVLPSGTMRFRPGVIRVAIGDPVPTVGLSPQARSELAPRVEAAVRALQEGLRRDEVS